MQIEPRVVCELGVGPIVVVGQAGMPHWTATIKEKIVRARENSLNIVKGVGRQRDQVKVPRGWVTSGRGV